MSAKQARMDAANIARRLVEVEQAARDVLVHAIDTDDGQRLRLALAALDETQATIRAHRKFERGAGIR